MSILWLPATFSLPEAAQFVGVLHTPTALSIFIPCVYTILERF